MTEEKEGPGVVLNSEGQEVQQEVTQNSPTSSTKSPPQPWKGEGWTPEAQRLFRDLPFRVKQAIWACEPDSKVKETLRQWEARRDLSELVVNLLADMNASDEAFDLIWKKYPWLDAGDFPDSGPLGVWDAGNDDALPSPRGWLLGNTFARKFLSSLLADGGVGKTALRYAQALALATGRPLTGEHVFQRCRVLIISLEDDAEELRRRIHAAMFHHKVDRSEVKGWLFLSAPGGKAGKLLTTDRGGKAVRGMLAEYIEDEILGGMIDLVIIDPFVKSHSVEENLNSVIDDVAQILTDLAATYDLAVDAPHHTSKGIAEPGNADRGRGASAMKDAARLVYTLTPMSAAEAEMFGINPDDRKQYVRLDSGKVNITKYLPAAKWFRLVGVMLGNDTDLYPHGDEVQTVEPWQPPNIMAGVTDDDFQKVAEVIRAGKFRKSPQANDWVGRAVAEALDLDLDDKRDRGKVGILVKAWLRAGTLVEVEYEDDQYKKRKFVEVAEKD
jgi:AAA domain-containing protein